ncbi:MAG: excinuclease ABC subunit B [Sphaerochaetaceae bacterium]|nr:excinuclease ABC subunit B [Sphaerochaetaceae bacterium]
MAKQFRVAAEYEPAGDQKEAIELLSAGIESGFERQTLKGVTGSGKTYTMAKIIERIQRPTLVLSHNKTLAAQLYREFKSFFPDNAVGYFVSTYDYYQPEAYVPGKDLYIEKDASINSEIDRLRLFASFSLMERRDVIIVATVSCIYGLGSPQSFRDMVKHVRVGDRFTYKEDLQHLVRMQYERNDMILERGNFRLKGDTLEVFPSYLETAVRINIEWDEIESIEWFDPLTYEVSERVDAVSIYPAKQFVLPPEQVKEAIGRIEEEKNQQVAMFEDAGKPLEAERIKTRVEYDLEMLGELGYCSGIENYSRPLGKRKEGEAPPVLLNYFPPGFLTFIDESHVTLPQIGAMYEGDRSRKLNLVNFGFRLPSALDNRPLKYAEFDRICGQRVYVTATPGKTELGESAQVVEQIIRPTGLLDPVIELHETRGQMEHLYGEIRATVAKGDRVLVTTLTKKMSEDLSNYLANLGIKVRYLHSEVETIERVEILRDLRRGVYDVIVGINLLREGLDLPEVSLIAILDADKIGFLRSATALIQTIGRAARNVNGRVVMYADKMSDAMKEAIEETQRRRAIQNEFNETHGITPQSIRKAVEDILEREQEEKEEIQKSDIEILKGNYNLLKATDRKKYIKDLEREMIEHAKNLEFEMAAILRDEIENVKQMKIS